MKRLATAIAILLLGTFSAFATPCAGIAGSMFGGFCIPFHALADPVTGLPLGTAANPLFVTGGSGGSSGPAAQGAPNAGGAAAWYVQWANQSVALSGSIPSGTNTIGAVTQSGWAVDDLRHGRGDAEWSVDCQSRRGIGCDRQRLGIELSGDAARVRDGSSAADRR